MKKGFTLLELLATIAIMAVLIAAVLPFVSSYTAWAKKTQAKRSALIVADAINRYNALSGASEPVRAPIAGTESAAIINSKLLGNLATIYVDGTDGVQSKFIAKDLSSAVSFSVVDGHGVVSVTSGVAGDTAKTASF